MDACCALEAKNPECDEKFGNHVDGVRNHHSLEKVGSEDRSRRDGSDNHGGNLYGDSKVANSNGCDDCIRSVDAEVLDRCWSRVGLD